MVDREPGGGLLTPRELEILKLIAGGLTCKEVAQKVDLAPGTVERHIENARHKMGARNRGHLITKALEAGEI